MPPIRKNYYYQTKVVCPTCGVVKLVKVKDILASAIRSTFFEPIKWDGD